MVNIDVLFPETGEPLLHSDDEAVMEQEYVTWHFKTNNPSIRRVVIEFDETAQQSNVASDFFPENKKNPARYERSLWNGDTIWGRAPECGKKNPRLAYKYSIIGLDENNKEIVHRDPRIVTPKH